MKTKHLTLIPPLHPPLAASLSHPRNYPRPRPRPRPSPPRHSNRRRAARRRSKRSKVCSRRSSERWMIIKERSICCAVESFSSAFPCRSAAATLSVASAGAAAVVVLLSQATGTAVAIFFCSVVWGGSRIVSIMDRSVRWEREKETEEETAAYIHSTCFTHSPLSFQSKGLPLLFAG